MSQQISTPARPSTPNNIPKSPSAPTTPATGTWSHPRLDEIIRRQNASNFSDRNLKILFYNMAGFVIVWSVGGSLWSNFPGLFLPNKIFHPYATWTYYIIQSLFLYNIGIALLPAFKVVDEMEDIPLTPAQRKLLGLPPSSRPATPDTVYVTPPRYSRTPTPLKSTPLKGSPGSKGGFSNSPLAGKGNLSPMGESFSESPFALGSSPLLQKAMRSGANGMRRHSYGSPSPLGPGVPKSGFPEVPGSPSPAAAKTPSVVLNSKWLYDKGRRNSGTPRMYT